MMALVFQFGRILAVCFLAEGLAALLPAALWYLRGRPGKLGVYGLACAGLYLLGALSLIFSGDASLKILTVFALAPLFLIVILAIISSPRSSVLSS